MLSPLAQAALDKARHIKSRSVAASQRPQSKGSEGMERVVIRGRNTKELEDIRTTKQLLRIPTYILDAIDDLRYKNYRSINSEICYAIHSLYEGELAINLQIEALKKMLSQSEVQAALSRVQTIDTPEPEMYCISAINCGDAKTFMVRYSELERAQWNQLARRYQDIYSKNAVTLCAICRWVNNNRMLIALQQAALKKPAVILELKKSILPV